LEYCHVRALQRRLRSLKLTPRAAVGLGAVVLVLSQGACNGSTTKNEGTDAAVSTAGTGVGGAGAPGRLPGSGGSGAGGALAGVAGVGGLPDCGPGCRIALGRPIQHGSGWGHAYDERFVADTNAEELFYAELGSGQTHVPVQRHVSLAAIGTGRISYVGFDWPAGEIAVLDIATGSSTVYQRFDDSTVYRPLQTFLSEQSLIWSHGKGIARADLATGAVTEISTRSLDCRQGCTAGGFVYCINADGDRVERIDELTGERRRIDDGGALQTEGGCSPDGKRLVWVDHRHPPGPSSSLFGTRAGSEIYLYNIESGSGKRLTHDSPENPVAKTDAAVGDDWVVWKEPCATCSKSFSQAGSLYAASTSLVRIELDTGRTCRLDDFPYGSWSSLHGHHFYAYWGAESGIYLVDVDLDDPSFAWHCRVD
jgi:hypothetical protein